MPTFKTVRCVVSCRRADGVPTLYRVAVTVPQAGYEGGLHHDMARGAAEEDGYEDIGLVCDEDDGPAWAFENWGAK